MNNLKTAKRELKFKQQRNIRMTHNYIDLNIQIGLDYKCKWQHTRKGGFCENLSQKEI